MLWKGNNRRSTYYVRKWPVKWFTQSHKYVPDCFGYLVYRIYQIFIQRQFSFYIYYINALEEAV